MVHPRPGNVLLPSSQHPPPNLEQGPYGQLEDPLLRSRVDLLSHPSSCGLPHLRVCSKVSLSIVSLADPVIRFLRILVLTERVTMVMKRRDEVGSPIHEGTRGVVCRWNVRS